MTTPDSIALAGILSRLRRDGVEAVALEASSHGLDQYRLDGVAITAAGFSNLTRDHLDYHGTLSEYRRAKLRLFDTLLPEGGLAAVNADMDAQTLERVTSIARTRRHQLRLVGERGTTMRLLRTTPQAGGQRLELEIGGRRHEVALPLPGRTQADNVLLATALADPDDASLERLLQHLPALAGVRGRMELAATLPNGAAAYVDYAHTPDALERLLHGLRPHAAGGRLVVVFGAGGDRDRGKRPMMGEVAQRLADVAIVTDDNPRSETPAAIRVRDHGRLRQRGGGRRTRAGHLGGAAGAASRRRAGGRRQGTRAGADHRRRDAAVRRSRGHPPARRECPVTAPRPHHDRRSGPATRCSRRPAALGPRPDRGHGRLDRHPQPAAG